MNSIEITKLNGGYDNKILLKELSLSLNDHKITAIAGPNGSGKSTLLKYLIKELKTINKTIYICYNDINELSQNEISKKISLVAQNSTKEFEFSVEDYVRLGRYTYKDVSNNTSSVEKALSLTGISDIRQKSINKISGGEFQLAVIARAICQDTDIIILDEPINNLDPYHQLTILNLLKKLSKQGKTIITVLHDLNSIISFSDYCILMKDGLVYSYGPTNQILTEKSIFDVYGIKCKFINQEYGHIPLITYYNL